MAKKGSTELVAAFVEFCSANCNHECSPGVCCADIAYDYACGADIDNSYNDIKKEFKSEHPCLIGKSFCDFLSWYRDN